MWYGCAYSEVSLHEKFATVGKYSIAGCFNPKVFAKCLEYLTSSVPHSSCYHGLTVSHFLLLLLCSFASMLIIASSVLNIASPVSLIASTSACPLPVPTLVLLAPNLVQHMWLFFEMILKSVAQYLKEVGKLDKLVSVQHLHPTSVMVNVSLLSDF